MVLRYWSGCHTSINSHLFLPPPLNNALWPWAWFYVWEFSKYLLKRICRVPWTLWRLQAHYHTIFLNFETMTRCLSDLKLAINWPIAFLGHQVHLCFQFRYHNVYFDVIISSYTVAYPGIFFGWGVQQIQLRTEDRENGDLGAVAP